LSFSPKKIPDSPSKKGATKPKMAFFDFCACSFVSRLLPNQPQERKKNKKTLDRKMECKICSRLFCHQKSPFFFQQFPHFRSKKGEKMGDYVLGLCILHLFLSNQEPNFCQIKSRKVDFGLSVLRVG